MKKWTPIILTAVLSLALCCGCSLDAGAASSSALDASASKQSASQVENSADSGEQHEAYTITRVDQAPDWSTIPQLDIDNVQWTDDYGICAHAQLAYDDNAIYVHMWAEEQDVRATYTADDPRPKCYEDSCLEFFIQPVDGDARYMNFEFNPNCALGCEIGTQKQGRVGLFPSEDALNAKAERTADGWELTYEVPFEFLQTLYPGFSAKSGMQIRGNLYKCGNLTANKHYLSWSLVDSEKPNFHAPDSFGTLAFE